MDAARALGEKDSGLAGRIAPPDDDDFLAAAQLCLDEGGAVRVQNMTLLHLPAVTGRNSNVNIRADFTARAFPS